MCCVWLVYFVLSPNSFYVRPCVCVCVCVCMCVCVIDTMVWSQQKPRGLSPPPRYYHSATYITHREQRRESKEDKDRIDKASSHPSSLLCVYGGRGAQVYGDVWLLDCQSACILKSKRGTSLCASFLTLAFIHFLSFSLSCLCRIDMESNRPASQRCVFSFFSLKHLSHPNPHQLLPNATIIQLGLSLCLSLLSPLTHIHLSFCMEGSIE